MVFGRGLTVVGLRTAPKGRGLGAELEASFGLREWSGELTLREVEERTARLAQQSGNSAYRVSASWLRHMREGENGGLSAMKLIVLAVIYDLDGAQRIELLSRCDLKSGGVR